MGKNYSFLLQISGNKPLFCCKSVATSLIISLS